MRQSRSVVGVLVILGGVFGTGMAPHALAQGSEVQQQLAALKQDAAANRQALANYTWQEQQTISIKGEVKKVQVYNVRLGSDGKPQRTPVDSTRAIHEAAHGIKGHIVERKKAEYQDYAKQIAALAESYMQTDPGKLQQLYQQGQIMAEPGTDHLVIHDYAKPGDVVTLTLDSTRQRLSSIHVTSYLSKPSDGVTITAAFAQLTDGPNHVSSIIVNGISKQLTVQSQNSNYQRLASSSS